MEGKEQIFSALMCSQCNISLLSSTLVVKFHPQGCENYLNELGHHLKSSASPHWHYLLFWGLYQKCPQKNLSAVLSMIDVLILNTLKIPLTHKVFFGNFFLARAKQEILLENGLWCTSVLKHIKETTTKTRNGLFRKEDRSCDLLCSWKQWAKNKMPLENYFLHGPSNIQPLLVHPDSYFPSFCTK